MEAAKTSGDFPRMTFTINILLLTKHFYVEMHRGTSTPRLILHFSVSSEESDVASWADLGREPVEHHPEHNLESVCQPVPKAAHGCSNPPTNIALVSACPKRR